MGGWVYIVRIYNGMVDYDSFFLRFFPQPIMFFEKILVRADKNV